MAHPGVHPETAGLTDTIKNINPRIKAAAIGLGLGIAADYVLAVKHKMFGALLGAALGALYSQEVENAAITGPAKPSSSG